MKKLVVTKNLKGMRYGTTLRPTRDWLALLAFAFLLMLASVAWNLWTFSKVTNGEQVGTAAPPANGDSAVLDAVTRLFEARAAEEARYRNEYRFVDPSR